MRRFLFQSRHGLILLPLAAWLLGGSGCASSRPVDVSSLTPTAAEAHYLEEAGLAPVQWIPAVEAAAPVPVGWQAEALKVQPRTKHRVWISPSGSTAFGVLNVQHLLLPFASDYRVMEEFLKGMKQTEGEAKLLEGPVKDRALGGGLGGLRFVAEGGKYKVRANLVSRGTRAWIVYAGTHRGQPFEPEELSRAEEARERTVVGLTEPPKTSPREGGIADARVAGEVARASSP
jgi:hypothetical protein